MTNIETPKTAQELVEKYCPDFEERRKEWNILKSRANQPKYQMQRGELCRRAKNLHKAMFSDALRAFAEVLVGSYEDALTSIRDGAYPSNEREAFIFVDTAKMIAATTLSAPSPLKTE